MPTIYGDGSVYADGSAYGRISALLAAAEADQVRQTALKVSVIDSNLNAWELLTGALDHPEGLQVYYKQFNGDLPSTDIRYYGYRTGTTGIILDNGNIIRVRLYDPSDHTNRSVWINVVTDPTDLASWDIWTVAFSGNNYACGLLKTGANTYSVEHINDTGYAIDGSVIFLHSDVGNGLDNGYIQGVLHVGDGIDYKGWIMVNHPDVVDGKRVLDFYMVSDITDPLSTGVYDWTINYRHRLAGFRAVNAPIDDPTATEEIHRVVSSSFEFNPRDPDHGIALWTDVVPMQSLIDDYLDDATIGWGTPPHIIRGVGGGSGRNWMNVGDIHKYSDGYYYMYATEQHNPQDPDPDGATSLGVGFPVWSRTKDLKHWSEWTPGPPAKNAGGGAVVERDGFIYWLGSELIYRRPATPTIYDVSNYVNHVDFELPRDNQAATGNVSVANPSGVNEALRSFSDREITIEPGLRVADGSYEYVSFDRFFVDKVTTEVKGKLNRLHLAFGNLWTRLDNSFRDITNFIGKTIWDDFQDGGVNKAYNYFFDGEDNPKVLKGDHILQATGLVLYTGWKGQNPDFTAHVGSFATTLKIVARYNPDLGYIYLEYDPDNSVIRLKELFKGDVTTLDTSSVSGDPSPKIRMRLRWNTYKVWFNDEVIMDAFIVDGFKNILAGYVGWIDVTE